MLKVFHISDDVAAAREIRSPMTDYMSDLLREIGEIDYANGGMTEHQRALYTVFANVKAQARDRMVRQAFDIGSYTHVANVAGNDLEVAYKHTQNGVLTESWSLSPTDLVQTVGKNFHDYGYGGEKYGRRSTDIGDLVEKEDGTLYVVSEIGFVEVNRPRRLTDDETAQVREALASGGRVSAVRLYRTMTNAALVDAVRFVDDLLRDVSRKWPRFTGFDWIDETVENG